MTLPARRLLPALLLLAAASFAFAPANLALAKPPETRVEAVKDVVHGVEIIDNYRWLEGDNSDPARMGTVTPEVGKWTDDQNTYTRQVLDGLPGRKELEAKLRPLMEVGSISAPNMKGTPEKTRYFFSKREGNQNQSSLYYRDGARGETKLLLDPAKIDPSGLTTISWSRPSEDGTLLAYGMYKSGDENSTLHVIRVESGEKLPVQIGGKVSGFDWLPDNSGFTYRNLADVKNPYSGQVMFHKMGASGGGNGVVADGKGDALLFRQYTKEENERLATTYGPDGGLSEDGHWLVLSYATDTRNNDLWVVDFSKYRRTAKVEKVTITEGEKGQSGGDIVGDTMYMLTTVDHPNGRVVAVDLKSPSKGNWKELVAERKEPITGVSVAKGILAVEYLKNASSQIELFDYSGKPLGNLKLPGIGSAGLSTNDDRTEAYLTFTSFNYPPSIFRVDLAKPNAEPELWERPAVPVDPTTVEVKQEWFSSKDGTKVPMFNVHKKGLKQDGKNPTILYGYGGFKVNITPSFSATMFQWFDAGGVYAIPNLRGGGEFGDAWHTAGMLEKKQRVFDDFIAAAEYLLCASGYTNPAKLAVRGGSNGGLLTGAMVTQRPDLFKAVLILVPLLDMVRYQDFLMAKYWVPEYGSAADAEQFKFIKAYSPYHNIKQGTKYPAVLLTAGENDARVHPLHARKMAAALRAATASDQEQNPILLWVDRDAGHGQGKPLNLRIRDTADERIFMMWQLGMLDKK